MPGLNLVGGCNRVHDSDKPVTEMVITVEISGEITSVKTAISSGDSETITSSYAISKVATYTRVPFVGKDYDEGSSAWPTGSDFWLMQQNCCCGCRLSGIHAPQIIDDPAADTPEPPAPALGTTEFYGDYDFIVAHAPPEGGDGTTPVTGKLFILTAVANPSGTGRETKCKEEDETNGGVPRAAGTTWVLNLSSGSSQLWGNINAIFNLLEWHVTDSVRTEPGGVPVETESDRIGYPEMIVSVPLLSCGDTVYSEVTSNFEVVAELSDEFFDYDYTGSITMTVTLELV